MRIITILIMGVLFCLPGWATVVDLRPDGDVQINWFVTGSGTGDCTNATAEYGCINSDVESPEDATLISISDFAQPGPQQEVSLDNTPGDFGSTNSITLKVRASYLGTDTGEDEIQVWLEVSGVQSGGTKRISEINTPDCTITNSTPVDCSLTDAAWDALSGTDIDNLTFVARVTKNNVAMSDDTNFGIYEVEIVLDYNAAVASEDDSPQQVID